MNRFDLPKDLIHVVGNERVDFAFIAKRKRTKSLINFVIIIAVIGLILPSIGAITFFISATKEPSTIKVENSEPLTTNTILFIFILLIGAGYLITRIRAHYKNKKEYYVGTKSRLISYSNGNIQYFDWGQFTGNITLNLNAKSISLEMRNVTLSTRNNNPYESIPEPLHLTGVENLLEIEKICRQRIKENNA